MGRRDFLVGWTMITIPTRCIQTSFFAAWLIIGMIRTFCSAFIVVLYPLCESSAALSQIVGGIIEVGVPFEPLCSDAVELFFFFFNYTGVRWLRTPFLSQCSPTHRSWNRMLNAEHRTLYSWLIVHGHIVFNRFRGIHLQRPTSSHCSAAS